MTLRSSLRSRCTSTRRLHCEAAPRSAATRWPTRPTARSTPTQQRGAGLPRAQRLAPRGRRLRRPAEVRRLVGHHDRPGQAGGHRPLLRHRRQQPGLLLRLHRADARQPRHRPRLRRRLPGGHGGRLGRCPGPPARRAGHPHAGGRDGRQPGRHAGAVVDAAVPRARAPRRGGGQRAQPHRREHRLQRGGAPRDRDRPRLPRRPLLRARRGARARPAHRAHDRPHHLPERRRDEREVRPPAARGHRPALHHAGRRVPDRELPALPGRQVQRVLRRQHLPADHARARLLRPGRAHNGNLAKALARGRGEVPAGELHHRLALLARRAAARS